MHAINFFTKLFFFQTLSDRAVAPAGHTLGAWVIVVPVLGGLVIGLIARYGSEQIRGHGIPEAIEAILFKKSAMSPKVAVLKPLASAIAIGSGGPFGALHRADHAALDPDREDRAARLSHLSRIRHRPARAPQCGRSDDGRSGQHRRGGHAGGRAGEPLRRRPAPSRLYGLNIPVVALAAETCRLVATRLAVHELERLPVVDDAKSRRLVGLVSRSDLIKASLTLHEEERHRQAFRRIRIRSSGQAM